jgi:hypothetical protein
LSIGLDCQTIGQTSYVPSDTLRDWLTVSPLAYIELVAAARNAFLLGTSTADTLQQVIGYMLLLYTTPSHFLLLRKSGLTK